MDHELFKHLCELARLRLDEADEQEFEAKFTRLLEMVDSLAAWEPQDGTGDSGQGPRLQLRSDTAVPFSWPLDTLLDYRVPMIIDFEGDS